MQKIERIVELAGHKKEDLSVCLGCKICASVCTVNDLGIDTNPQELLAKLFLGQDIGEDHALLCYCTNCYRCTGACPWNIRIPELVRALKESLGMEGRFEKAFKKSVGIWGRVYEPFVVIMAAPDLLKGGYIKYMTRWMEYAGIHLPHKVKRLSRSKSPNSLRGEQ
jgi:heterodisulfide reductase subunit C